jgi:acyl-CoA synthetase (AMP-forming)/AMP-acid ligase II
MLIEDLLAAGVRRFPDRACVVESARSHTFAQTDERAARLADALAGHGIGAGDRVALLAMNELEYTEILVGVNRVGATLVPLNYRLAVPELRFIAENSDPALVIHGPGLESAAAAVGRPTWHLGDTGHGESYEQALAAATPQLELSSRPASEAVQILYTSGTTGRPKGAVLSRGALYARVNTCVVETAAGADSVFVQPLPMFHIAAHVSWAFTYVGATCVSARAFDPQSVLDAVAANSATHLMLVPAMINALCAHPGAGSAALSSLQMVLYGASPIAPELLRRAIGTFCCAFQQFYGMTETFAITMLRSRDHDPAGGLLASAGTDAVGIRSRVVDGEDRELPAGGVGEIVARGPHLMSRYWRNQEATEAALGGGWMHTGDLGYVSEDGYLHVVDRVKDMVVSGGENVYPREVEDVLAEHRDIYEAAVIGIPHERWGEQVHAIVVPRPGVELTEAGVIEHCRGRLAGYKIPKSVTVVGELPRNAAGKVLKAELRAPYWTDHVRAVS